MTYPRTIFFSVPRKVVQVYESSLALKFTVGSNVLVKFEESGIAPRIDFDVSCADA
jgi:hypothetical protein